MVALAATDRVAHVGVPSCRRRRRPRRPLGRYAPRISFANELPPVLLLPPSHVSTPSLGPPAHRPLAPRINEWGPGASRPETYDWVAEYTPDYAATERRSDVGGVCAARLLQEIAELVPEGSTLVLHPNAELSCRGTHPRHHRPRLRPHA